MRGIHTLLVQKRQFAVVLTVILLVAVSVAWLSPAAPLDGPGKNDREVTLAVSSMIRDEHLSRHPLDDEISRRALNTFVESFDPRKLYFLQSDIDEFMTKRDELDDDVKNGRVDFAYTVFDRFTERLADRIKLIEELVNQPRDFSLDEELKTDPDVVKYCKDVDALRVRWRNLVKYNLLTFKTDGIDDEEARKKIRRRYHLLKKRWDQSDSDELLERYLTSVASSFDPHTTYMSPSSLENFRILMRLNLEGIGAVLNVSEEGYTLVARIIPGGAADKQGKLKPDDRIVSVGQGQDGELVDVVDMKLNDVVKLIRGRASTVVRLGIISADSSETRIYAITRAKVELKDSAARTVILERGTNSDGSPVKIGIINLPSFYMDMEAARKSDGRGSFRSTTRDARKILQDFKSKEVDLVILDLRQNGGGSLTEAINLTGLFIDKGPIVQVKNARGRVQTYNDVQSGMAWDGPLVVLTSKISASASEILAGAIQDYRRGLIIGDEATHGKGTVQSLLDLGSQLYRVENPPKLGALKITMQQFYRPNGDSTQKRGILPDIVLPSLSNHIGLGEADLDYAIEFDRVPAARFDTYNMVGADTIAQLKTHSKQRVQKSDEFGNVAKTIDRYKTYKEEKSIPLNEKRYLARRQAERDVEKAEEQQFDDQTNANDVVFADDFYNKEVIAISLEYLKELANNKVAQTN